MERNGIDKLKKACIILPLVVAVIFNSSVAAIERENNSKLSCGIDSYYVKDMVAQDDHIWFLLHDSSIGKDAVACINEKTLELQACYRSGENLEDEMIIQNMSVQPNGSVWLDLFYPKNPKGLQYSLFILQDNVNVAAASNVVLCENVALWENGSSLCYWDSDEIVKSVDIPAGTEPYAISALNGRPCFVDACIDTDSLTDSDTKFSTSTDYYGFLDADESAWYGSQQQGVIKSVVQLGIMNGYTDGTFHPIGNITLSEAIKMAAVVHATCNNQTISFSASDGGKWYDAYLNYPIKHAASTDLTLGLSYAEALLFDNFTK